MNIFPIHFISNTYSCFYASSITKQSGNETGVLILCFQQTSNRCWRLIIAVIHQTFCFAYVFTIQPHRSPLCAQKKLFVSYKLRLCAKLNCLKTNFIQSMTVANNAIWRNLFVKMQENIVIYSLLFLTSLFNFISGTFSFLFHMKSKDICMSCFVLKSLS